MESKIWIVSGSSGEYSDRTDWTVEAWTTEEAAKARVAALDALLLQHGFKHGRGDYETQKEREKALLATDPQFQCDYTGTDYTCYECVLRTAVE